MSLRPGLSIAIVSAVFVSQMILHIDAQSGVAKKAHHITFDCDPEQLHGAAKLTCLVKRFEEGRRLFDEETFQGQRPDLRHVPQCQERDVLAPGRAEATGGEPRRSPVRG